ncbi:MAG: serine/threonine-protein kinase [Polyangiaceae bacterium]
MSAGTAAGALPRRFGRYALFDFIGKGGMAEIYLARAEADFGAARLCVVKEILPVFANNPQFADMLVFEAKLAARLSHANIVQVFDLGREQDRLYIAMEYVEGLDLNGLLRECTKHKIALPLEFALFIIQEILRGLDYAHRRTDDEGLPLGVVHRDVSPSNVLLSFEGEVKVCDFGIAHANDLVENLEGALGEAIVGKAGYMSPEQANGEVVDARADVFAVGILLWELLAGKRMYRASEGRSLIEVARAGVPPELGERGIVGEAALRSILDKALSRDRESRFETAGLMLRALEEYAATYQLLTSSLTFGAWLVQSFGTNQVDGKKARELILTPAGAATTTPEAQPKELRVPASPLDEPLSSLVSHTPVPKAVRESRPEPPAPAAPRVDVSEAESAAAAILGSEAEPPVVVVPHAPPGAPVHSTIISSPGAMRTFKEKLIEPPPDSAELAALPVESVRLPAAPMPAPSSKKNLVLYVVAALVSLFVGYWLIRR